MFRGFNLELPTDEDIINNFYTKGKILYSKNKRIIKNNLNSFIDDDGSLNATKMEENWFPTIQADIFISHSHQDHDLAIALAGFLYESLDITTFIDSCIWGNAKDLLYLIDDKFCRNEGKETFSYSKRNKSTSHVHMMLSTALSMMMDRTECTFFLNTPSSICPKEVINRTYSPWIYYEIAIMRLIRKKPINDHRIPLKEASVAFAKAQELKMKYEVNLTNLTEIDLETIYSWAVKIHDYQYKSSLDALYELCPLIDGY